MSTKSDWEAAAEDFMAAERERLGGPPAPEEVVAYARGELPEADAARVRSLLIYYPELTSVLTEPAPLVEISHRRITPASAWAAAASVLFIMSAGLGVQVQRMSHELNEPHVISTHGLRRTQPTRGPRQQPNRLAADEKNSVFVLEDLPEDTRRIELMNGTTRVWTATVVPHEDEPVQVSVPRGLAPGTYRLDAYGADDSEPIATYELVVTRAARP